MNSGGNPFPPHPDLPVVAPQYVPMIPPPHLNMQRARPAEPELNLEFLFSVWTRWWKTIVPCTLLLAAASAAAVFYLVEPKFTAVSYVEIKDVRPWLIAPSEEDARNYAKTQIGKLRSPLVLQPAVADPEIAEMPEIKGRAEPVKWLARNLEVVSPTESQLYEVRFTGKDREAAAQLVNAVVDSFIKFLKETEASERLETLNMLMESQQECRRRVASQQENVRKLKENILAHDPDAAAMSSQVVFTGNLPTQQLDERFFNARLELDMLERKLAYQESKTGKHAVVSEGIVRQMVDQHPDVRVHETGIEQLRQRMQEHAEVARLGDKDPGFLSLQKELVTREKRLTSLQERLRANFRGDLAEQAEADRQDATEQLRSEIEHHRALVADLQKELQEKREKLVSSTGQISEVAFAENTLRSEEMMLERINTRINELKTENNVQGRVTLQGPAAVPTNPEPSPTLKYLLVALGLSMTGPFGLATLWERMARRITGAEQLEQQANLAVVGEIARLPLRQMGNSRIASLTAGRDVGIYEESIDSLRTSLTLAQERQDLQVFAVCSSIAAEGKTSIATQLAVSLARASGRPTLLIDGDMRAPDIHNIFDISKQPGLAKVLEGDVSLDEAIVRTWSDHVHLLPAGEIQKSPHKLLGSGTFQQLLDEARLWYRYIVIDTPPVLAASEALIMAKAADGTLICVMNEMSRGNHVRTTYERLVAAGAHPIGAVLNGVSTRRYAYRYGSYYAYARKK